MCSLACAVQMLGDECVPGLRAGVSEHRSSLSPNLIKTYLIAGLIRADQGGRPIFQMHNHWLKNSAFRLVATAAVILALEIIISLFETTELLHGNSTVIAAISIQATLFIIAAKHCINRKELLYSPFFLFYFTATFFAICSEITFLLRDYLDISWGGEPERIAAFYRRTCITLYLLFLCFSQKQRNKSISLLFLNIRKPSPHLAFLILIGYIGIFLSTDHFTQISILSENPDATRYANRNASNIALGSLLLISSTTGTFILASLRSCQKISTILFLFLLSILYIPLLFSASRLLILLPLIYIFIVKINNIKHLSGKDILNSTVFIILILACAIAFGAYRSQGGLDGSGTVATFLVSDIFPEFSGTVLTQNFVGNTEFLAPMSTILAGLLPSRAFEALGLSKFDYFQPPGQVIGELWNSQYTIRLSLIGELYYSNLIQLGFFIAFLAFLIIFLDKKIYNPSTRYRFIYLISSVLASLSIPYGALFLVITVQFLIFSALFFYTLGILRTFCIRLKRRTSKGTS